MKGDFSRWNSGENKNHNGVLHQQGRVLTDNDWNAGTRLLNAWQEQAGRDTIGPGVAAVPAEASGSFKVKAAVLVSGATTQHVELDILPGRVWADGLLTHLAGDANAPAAAMKRTATYLEPPFQAAADNESNIAAGARDAVVLEVWQEALNAFQVPGQLLEPALGGIDTTERVHTSMAFRLLRLKGDERCEDVPEILNRDVNKGSLVVTLAPPETISGDCPVEEGGGYSGFEHHLYRIEIAQLDDMPLTLNGPMFKWSRFNGGLVGRGEFSTSPDKLKITGNYQAINASGLTSIYLEALEYDGTLGHWKVTYGATATLDGTNEVDLTSTTYCGEIPTSGKSVFFRIWDGIEPIRDFPLSTSSTKPVPLADWEGNVNGIRLEFESDTGNNYKPGDYWTFEVRAGGIGNPPVNVPIFSLSSSSPLSAGSPYTTLKSEFDTNGFPLSDSLTVTVKTAGAEWLIVDSVTEESYTIKDEAGTLNVYHMTLIKMGPPDGTRFHRVPLAILEWNGTPTLGESDIRDCRRRFRPLTQLDNCCTVFVGKTGDFHDIQEAVNYLSSRDGGRICVLPGTYEENVIIANTRDITICGCGESSKIVSDIPDNETMRNDAVIQVIDSENIRIQSLVIEAHLHGPGIQLDSTWVDDEEAEEVASSGTPLLKDIVLLDLDITAAARGAIEAYSCRFTLIRDCRIRMQNVSGPWPGIYIVGDDVTIENNEITVPLEMQVDVDGNETGLGVTGLGGIQVGGTSDRVRIIDNLIQRGMGTGIVLGHILEMTEYSQPVDGYNQPWHGYYNDYCYPCRPGSSYVPPDEGETSTTKVSAGALSEILIKGNRILDMGLNGIGVEGFFNLDAADEFITVERLTIQDNEIRNCLNRPLRDIPDDMTGSMGYGAIALADVEYLVIDNNVIEDNGPDNGSEPHDPVCGIYILHGEGIDIFDNRILNNGASSTNPTSEAKRGPRGGIHIAYAVAPVVNIELAVSFGLKVPRQNGVPAARIHDNIVTSPLGRALAITALGPVSVVGNQFTSRGMVLKGSDPSFLAAAVSIINLGISNEFYGQLLLFALRLFGAAGKNNLTFGLDNFQVTDDAFVIPQKGLDDMVPGQYLANGNVLFSNNQCTLDLLEKGVSYAVSSILILTLDDIGFHNNQCDCSLLDDFIIIHSVLLGLSLRVSDNRFKEGLINNLISAFTFGVMNMTTHNEATHCLWINGMWGNRSPNTVLLSSIFELITDKSYCDIFRNVLGERWM
jgi:hypothetical protein